MRFQSGWEYGVRGIKSGELFLPVQFGGTIYDSVSSIKKLSNGDIVACGATYSTTFLGQDASAYFNGGTYALWLGIFDAKTFAKKALIFENGRIGSTNAFWLNTSSGTGENGYNSVVIDSDDNIYTAYGPYSTATEMLVKKRSGTDLSLLATGTKYSIHYAGGSLLIDGNYLYLITQKADSYYSYFRKINTADLTLSLSVDLGTTYIFNTMILSDSYIYGFRTNTGTPSTNHIVKLDLSGSFVAQIAVPGTIFASDAGASSSNSITTIGDYVYLSGVKYNSLNKDIIISCRSKTDFTQKSGWTNVTIDCSFGTVQENPIVYLQAIGERLFYYGHARSGISTSDYWDLLLFGEINPDTGALISSYTQPKYKDNVTLISKDGGTDRAFWIPCGKPVLIGSKTLLCGVSATGRITGATTGNVVFLPLNMTTGNLYI